MNITSAFINKVLQEADFDTWSSVRKHYLPVEYHTLFTVIDKHCAKHHKLPTMEELKFAVRDAQTRDKLYSIEAVEVDVDPSLLLKYIKNEYTQREVLNQLEVFVDRSIAFEDAEETLSHLHSIVLDVESKVDIRDPAETMERITLFESDEELDRYITLGLNSDYDAEFKFSPKDFILLGGRRGAGKSVTCANIAVNSKNSGKAAVYFTIEMDARNILQRCCSIETGVPFGRLRTKNMGIAEWELVAKWWCDRREHGDFHYKEYLVHRDFDKLHQKLIREDLVPNQITVIYDPALTLATIASEVDKLTSKSDLGVIIVDYINQVKRSIVPGKQYDWTEQIEVSKALKALAQEYEVPVISPYQIDATGEARFAKGILDAADAAYTMETYNHSDGCVTFNCTKMRNGAEDSFTSEVNWQTLKIGPNSAETPKEKEAKKKSQENKSTEEINEVF